MIGTEKDRDMLLGSSCCPSEMGSLSLPSVFTLELDIQRYIVGMTGAGVADASPDSSASASNALDPEAGIVGRSSAVESAFRLPLVLDCFFSRRLIVSAYDELLS